MSDLVLVQEIFGVHEHIKDVCRRFGKLGYVAIAPELYARQGDVSQLTDINDIITKARRKHTEHNISADPYVFIKADSGTYGMGIMTAQSGAEMLELNKKDRNKMQVIKEGARVSEVILQEGIPTIDVVDGKPAEPMVYMIDGLPVGGMYRVNGERDATNNLNTTGMQFVGMCDELETVDCDYKPVKECDFRAYGIVAAIAALESRIAPHVPMRRSRRCINRAPAASAPRPPGTRGRPRWR